MWSCVCASRESEGNPDTGPLVLYISRTMPTRYGRLCYLKWLLIIRTNKYGFSFDAAFEISRSSLFTIHNNASQLQKVFDSVHGSPRCERLLLLTVLIKQKKISTVLNHL